MTTTTTREEVGSASIPPSPIDFRARALLLVAAERVRQENKFGVQHRYDLDWFPILTEEVGEVAKEIVEHCVAQSQCYSRAPEGLIEELTHVAAVAVAHIEDILHRRAADEGESNEDF